MKYVAIYMYVALLYDDIHFELDSQHDNCSSIVLSTFMNNHVRGALLLYVTGKKKRKKREKLIIILNKYINK